MLCSEDMDLTNNHRALIIKGLRDNGVTQTELSQKMGFGKAWVTKLLNGTLKSVSDADALRLQEILKIQFYQLKEATGLSGIAVEVEKRINENSHFANVMREMIAMMETAPFVPRYFKTKEMTKLGQEIIRLAFANEDKPGKVAREVLKLVSK